MPDIFAPRVPGRQPVAAGLLLSWALLAGCQQNPATPDLGETLRAASGVTEAVTFSVEGEPESVADVPANALTVAAAIELAIRHSPELQAAIAKVHAALADARQARLLPNPVLSVIVRFPEGGGKPDIDAGLTADLVSLLRMPRQITAADKRLAAASAEAVTVAIDVVSTVQERYAAVQSLESQIVAIEQRTKLVDRLLDLAKARLGAGESGRLDVLTFESEQAELSAEAIERRATLRDQRLALARLVGNARHAAMWTIDPWTSPATLAVDEGSLIATALAARPEVQAASWELQALGADVAASGLLNAIDGADAGVEAERDDGNWSIGPGASVPIPLFDWGQQRTAAAQANQSEARHRLVQAKRQVIEDVRRAAEAYRSAAAAATVVRDRVVPLQEQRRQRAEESYKAGFEDITAVLIAEQESQASRLRLIELQEKLSTATFRLQRAVGGSAALSSVAAAATQPTTTVSNINGSNHE